MKFGVGDVVLLWNKNKEKPNNHGKLEKLGMGPYRVSRITSKGSVVGNIGRRRVRDSCKWMAP